MSASTRWGWRQPADRAVGYGEGEASADVAGVRLPVGAGERTSFPSSVQAATSRIAARTATRRPTRRVLEVDRRWEPLGRLIACASYPSPEVRSSAWDPRPATRRIWHRGVSSGSPEQRTPSVGAWRSLVARIVRDDKVGGSNP